MRPVRIDQVVPSFGGRDAIGAHILHLSDLLRDLGFESDVWCKGAFPETKTIARFTDDLPEAIVGDSIPGERTKERKLKLESTAMKEILEEMPPAQRREYGMIWEEFNSGESEEALLVREVDKLEMAVQASEYRSAHAGPGTEEFIESARAAIRDPDLLALLRLVSQPG